MIEVKVKTNAGKIGFVLGMLATLGWAFFGNALQYSIRRLSMFDALTNDYVMSANGLGQAWSGGTAIAVIAIVAVFVGSVIGLLFHMAAGTKTVVIAEDNNQYADINPSPEYIPVDHLPYSFDHKGFTIQHNNKIFAIGKREFSSADEARAYIDN